MAIALNVLASTKSSKLKKKTEQNQKQTLTNQPTAKQTNNPPPKMIRKTCFIQLLHI